MATPLIAPQPGKQELALNLKADVIFYGGAAGSAKSYTELMRLLMHYQDPKFDAIFFRRTTIQISGAGGLWQTAQKMYQPFGARVYNKDSLIKFPSGCRAKFTHLELEKNAYDHQGLQYSAIFWDELQHFTETQFTYLLSRLRSEAEGDSYTFATMNPDCDSWILKYIKWYLDEDGFPDPEKDGRVRYFIMVDDEPIFADTEQELIEKYPDRCYVTNPRTGDKVLVRPKSFVFLSGTIFDNPKLIESNPKYLAELQNLPRVERDRLLHGNWYVREEGSKYWKREWLKKARVPHGVISCRAYDKAGTVPSEGNPKPDYTACIKISKDKDGNFYLSGDFHPDFKDDSLDAEYIYGRFRKLAGQRDQLILKQSRHDGRDCKIVVAIDPGSAGKTEYDSFCKKFVQEGFMVSPDPMPNNNSKLVRFTPFASACENGLVFIDEDSFTKETLAAYYKELESFDGTRSTKARKDDWADATASGFNFISKKRPFTPIKAIQSNHTSKLKSVIGK